MQQMHDDGDDDRVVCRLTSNIGSIADLGQLGRTDIGAERESKVHQKELAAKLRIGERLTIMIHLQPQPERVTMMVHTHTLSLSHQCYSSTGRTYQSE
jgi:hypothetical protein